MQSQEQQAQVAQYNQDTQAAEKLRAEATAERQRIRANLNLLMEQFLAPGNLYNLMVLGAPRRKGEIPNPEIFNPAVFNAVLRTWRSIENIRHEGNWSLLTQTQRDEYNKIQFMLSAFASYSGVDLNTPGLRGGGSKKKRKRKRKTRRKKKKRKKKTIKRRRKRGRKTRRK